MTKRNLSLLIALFLTCIFSKAAVAEDIYIEYATTDQNGKSIYTNIYLKNGDVRMDLAMVMSKISVTTTSLILKNNPDIIIIFNSFNKSYTKTAKPPKKTLDPENYNITVIGKEKVGIYNCTRVRVKVKDKSFDMWCTKDLPQLQLPIENSQAGVNKKLSAELESKGISGMMVKMVHFTPGTTTPKLTMELKKYETKPLSTALFKIPSDYKEGKGNPYKNMSQAQKNEMTKQIMEQLKKKQ